MQMRGVNGKGGSNEREMGEIFTDDEEENILGRNITENEARGFFLKYNKQIDKNTSEIERTKANIENLKNQMVSMKKHSFKVSEDFRRISEMAGHLDLQVQIKKKNQEELSGLSKSFPELPEKDSNQGERVTSKDALLERLKAAINELTNGLSEAKAAGEDFRVAFQSKNEVLKKQSEMQFCAHCKKDFSPLLNNEKACYFHPGKMKFYSCRECGKDEYFICCNKCYQCSIGCRQGKHVAK